MDAILKSASAAVAHAFTPGKHPHLYVGVDKSALALLDRLWMSWFELFGNPVLATGVAAFVLHEVVYFGRCVPFMWMDSRPDLFLEYKIQPKQHISAAEQWACTKTVLANHFLFELPQMMAFHHAAVLVGMRTYEVPLPSLKTMAWQLALFFLVEDAYHYWAHRLFHVGWLYRNVHKQHHKYTAPFGLAAEYSHPIEILLFGLGTVVGPLICCYAFGEMHLATMFVWIALRMLQAIDSHCGYDFPCSLRAFLPLWAGADHHDYHHQAFRGCYASSFRHWDYLMGTEASYHKVRLQQRREKALRDGKIVFGRKQMASEMGQEERVKVE